MFIGFVYSQEKVRFTGKNRNKTFTACGYTVHLFLA